MKKLKELKKDELKNLFQNNNDFQNKIIENCYNTIQYMTDELNNELFVESSRQRGYRYHDNYMSFYFRLTDAEEFVNGLKDGIGDYFDESDKKEYEKMLKLADEYWNLESDDLYGEKGEKIYDALEESAKKVLLAIENLFHDIEEPTDDMIDEEIESALDYMGDYEVGDDGSINTHIEVIWR